MPLVRTGIIGLVGISPIGDNEMRLITNQRNATNTYGQEVPGFSIPQSLKAIFDQGASGVLVINVFDPLTMTATVAAESLTIANGGAKLSAAPVVDPVVLTNAAGTVTYDEDVEYKIDVFGNIVVLDPTIIANGATVLATFKKLDAAEVTAASIIGTISGSTYTGLQLLRVAQSRFGFSAKIMIAPKYCELPTVAAEMLTIASLTRSVTYIDGPSALVTEDTVSDVIQERGPSGTYAGFQSNSNRLLLTWPHALKRDPDTDGNATFGQSAYWAGITAALPFWVSPSNKAPNGVLGTEVDVTGNINATGTDANELNAAGIATLTNISGLRTWGNRNASFPGLAGAETFITTTRIRDIMEEATEQAMLPFVDQPISTGLIDAIVETVNTYFKSLIQRGALVDAECFLDPELNPAAQVANGQLVFSYEFAPTIPAERITFNSTLDINRLAALFA